MKISTKKIGKSDLAALAGISYGALCACIFFGVWVLGGYELGTKITITLVAVICAILSVGAILAKLHGLFTRSVKTSFLFGIFIIFFASVICYLSVLREFALAFYVFLSTVFAGLGTYFLVYSAKVER